MQQQRITMKTQYVKQSAIRAAAKTLGRRISADAMYILDYRVGQIVRAACAVHNGGRITIDSTVMLHVVGNKPPSA